MSELPHQHSRTFAARLQRQHQAGASEHTGGAAGSPETHAGPVASSPSAARPRVVFVDDEKHVLDGLRRSLATVRDRWEMAFASDASAALMELGRQRADVVVADLRMPGMDGAELLGRVRAEFPDTLRVMLSSMGEDQAALRSLDAVHQYVAKPCESTDLVALLDRANGVRLLIGSVPLKRLVGRVGHLPPTPVVYCELLRCISNSHVSVRSVANVISRDPALAAKLLQVGNSAFFNRGRPIRDVATAVAHIGLDLLRTLVLMLEVFSAPSDEGAASYLQRRALRAMLIAEHIAAQQPFRTEAMTAALLCDVGLLIPGLEAHCHDAERRGEGRFRYPEVGAYLLGMWGLPVPLIAAVAHHQGPTPAQGNAFDSTGVAHVATALARDVEPNLAYLESVGQLAQLDGWRQFATKLARDPA